MGTVGHRAMGGHPLVCPVVSTTEWAMTRQDGTAWADVQAIQLRLNTCFLCGWDATSLTVLGRCHIDK